MKRKYFTDCTHGEPSGVDGSSNSESEPHSCSGADHVSMVTGASLLCRMVGRCVRVQGCLCMPELRLREDAGKLPSKQHV